jgi:hypothetical protein
MVATVNVRVLAVDQGGNPLVGATVSAKLSHQDYDAGGIVVPELIQAATDATGSTTLALWPNARGTAASRYNVKITNPDTAETTRLSATIPDADCDLHAVADLPEVR